VENDETAEAFLARHRHDPAGAQRELDRRRAEQHRRLILAGQGLLIEGINYWPKANSATVDGGKPPGRPKGSQVPIPEDTLLEVLRLVVHGHASARAIAKTTDERQELSFVNRIKAGGIKEWTETHLADARRAVDRQEIPADFPAAEGGVLLPKH
jgi:hypothetical protein